MVLHYEYLLLSDFFSSFLPFSLSFFFSSLLHLVSNTDVPLNHAPEAQRQKRDTSLSDLGPLKDNERQDLNCAVKEYLLIAGYRLTAMTFYEEVYHITNG